jgi:hypothetical protein
MYIAPNVHAEEYKRLNLDYDDSPDWGRAIEIFKLRISSRYLEPVDLLIKEDSKLSPIDRRFGFSILAIDCLLIETLQSFREGLTDTKGKSKDMFVNFLTQRQSFKEHFIEKDAKKFYEDIRCGILHQAEIMGDTLLWSVGMVKGKKGDGIPYINRTKIHELIKKEVDLYCDELRNKDNIDIRKKFRKKMDFIARKQE